MLHNKQCRHVVCVYCVVLRLPKENVKTERRNPNYHLKEHTEGEKEEMGGRVITNEKVSFEQQVVKVQHKLFSLFPFH